MCMSPDEMSDERIEHSIEQMKRWIEDGEHYWQSRLEQFELIMTERTQVDSELARRFDGSI